MAAFPTTKQPDHLIRLDVLRGVAILLVFLFHFNSTLFGPDRLEFSGFWGHLPHQWLEPSTTLAWTRFLWYPLTLGWSGVALFFVLSGFVIHWSFLNARRFDLSAFFWRRFWRIYPPYFVALLFFLWYSGTDLRTLKGAFQGVSHLLLIHNFHPASLYGVSGIFWSLAVESQFYLMYPAILYIRRRSGGDLPGMRRALVFTLVISGIWLVSDILLGGRGIFTRQFTFAHWFEWTLGAYVAECFHHQQRAFPWGSWALFGFLAGMVAASLFAPLGIVSYGIAALFFAGVLEVYVLKTGPLRIWERWLVPLGLCSYSLYLWHHPFLRPILTWLSSIGLARSLATKWLVGLPLCLAILLLLSWCLYLSVERFGVRIGKSLHPRIRRIFSGTPPRET